jgi:hypothetical protein
MPLPPSHLGKVILSALALGWWAPSLVRMVLIFLFKLSRSVLFHFIIPYEYVRTGMAKVLMALMMFFPFSSVLRYYYYYYYY